MLGLRTLVLNNNFMPVEIFPELKHIPAEDAIHNYLGGSCEVIAWYDRPVLTPSRIDLKWPSVVMNKTFSGTRKELGVRLRNETLFYRDHGICQYCENPLDLHGGKDNPKRVTKDHVVPRSAGGPDTWDNVVASCRRCNALKDSNAPTGKWKPKRQPWTPNFYQLLEIRKKFPLYVHDESWIPFLPQWAGEVIVKDHSCNYRNNVVEFKCDTVAA
jgi:5-methylcytosine-specific restriction endonuclease McrA